MPHQNLKGNGLGLHRSLPLDCALRTHPNERAVHSPLDRPTAPVDLCRTDERRGQPVTSFTE